jgi:hypothetical protein
LQTAIEPEYYTPAEVAILLGGFSERVIKRKCASDEIPGAEKIFGEWRIRIVDFRRGLLNGKCRN